ncbi:MAG TPA: hypothetical protein VF170_16425 [Planctomycetaceae bacterium]
MTRHVPLLIPLMASILLTTGCDRDERLARFAEQAAERQAEQNRRMAELQREVAAGSRQLVEADAKARTEFTELHRDLQSERSDIGKQRDALEAERREIASRRVTDPLIAAAVMDAGLLLACLLPLVLGWHLLRQADREPADALVTAVLLEDLIKDRPLLLSPASPRLLTAEPPETRNERPS